MHLDAAALRDKENSEKRVREVEDLQTCVKRNQAFAPNYEERVATWKRSLRGVALAINQVGEQTDSEETVAGSLRGPNLLDASKRLQFAEHGRDQFRNGWVNVHCPLHHRIRCLSIH
jgi:hypothetical protein